MYNKNLKLIAAGLIIAFAIYQFTEGLIGNGIMWILISGIFILFYFKNEFILLAFNKLRKENFDGAQKWLDKIKDPEKMLVKKQQGYYWYLHGLMLSQENLLKAEKFFKRSLKLGLSMKHDRAMANLNLAGIAMSKRRKREAQRFLKEAQKLDKHNMMTEQIRMMKQQMKRI